MNQPPSIPPLPPTVPALPANANASAASPIADLSYRSYDGVLQTRTLRWWIVAISAIRLVRKKVGFWVLVALSALPCLIAGVMIYIQNRAAAGSGMNPMDFLNGAPPDPQKYAKQFFQVFSGQEIMLFSIALMVGAGSIASDNRANALIVYLSKPITKGDYLLGKWMGVFLTLFAVSFAPMLLLYLFCLLSYNGDGFFKNEPTLILRILGAACVPGIVHASLLLGCSAWSKTSRIAGAAYAGLYFVSIIVVQNIANMRYHGRMDQGILLRHLSIDGVIKGVGQNIFNIVLTIPIFSKRTQTPEVLTMTAPDLWPMLAIAVGLVVVGLVATRAKIKAVEVVRG